MEVVVEDREGVEVLSNVCPLIYPKYMPECQHDADPYKNDTHRGVHMFKFH